MTTRPTRPGYCETSLPHLLYLALGIVFVWFLLTGRVAAATEAGTLRLVIPPVDTATQLYSRFKPLADHLGRATGRRVTITLCQNLDEFYARAREEVPQVVYFCPLTYIKLAHETAYYPLAGMTLSKGGMRSVILVHHDSPIRSVADLKGRSLALGNVACASSYLVPHAMLEKRGMQFSDFLEVRQTGSDQAALMAVAARLYDVTATGEDVAAPFLKKGVLRPLLYSPPMPTDLIAANQLVPAPVREQVRQALLQLHNTKGRRIIVGIKPDAIGFAQVRDSDYDLIRAMQRRISGENLQAKPLPDGAT